MVKIINQEGLICDCLQNFCPHCGGEVHASNPKAKEKAQELVDRMEQHVINYEDSIERMFKRAVACAKIAVQEILSLDVIWSETLGVDGAHKEQNGSKRFWEEVLSELDKIIQENYKDECNIKY